MRLGLLADIHEAVEPLARAVRELRSRHVDTFVMLGDLLENGERIAEVVELMASVPGVGVWGNHDFGLCGEVDPSVRAKFSAGVLEYFSSLRPWVDVEGCRFQHIDPHLDPEKFEDLWRFPRAEERMAGLDRCVHSRVCVGHLHEWGVFTPKHQIMWNGEDVFQFQAEERYLMVVNAVVEGWCAILDTDRDALEPIPLG